MERLPSREMLGRERDSLPDLAVSPQRTLPRPKRYLLPRLFPGLLSSPRSPQLLSLSPSSRLPHDNTSRTRNTYLYSTYPRPSATIPAFRIDHGDAARAAAHEWVRQNWTEPDRNGAGRVKRPLNCFMLFRTHWVANEMHKDENKTADGVDWTTSKRASHAWAQLSEDDKSKWELRAEAWRDRHQSDYPEYKYAPRRGAVRGVLSRSSTQPKLERPRSSVKQESQDMLMPHPAQLAQRRRSRSVPPYGTTTFIQFSPPVKTRSEYDATSPPHSPQEPHVSSWIPDVAPPISPFTFHPPPYPVFDFFDVDSTGAHSTMSSPPVSSPSGEFSWANHNFQPFYQPTQWNGDALPPHIPFSPAQAPDAHEYGIFAQLDNGTISPFYPPSPFPVAPFHGIGLLEHPPAFDGQSAGNQALSCALPYPLVPSNAAVHVHSGSDEEDERLAQAAAPQYIY